MAYSKKIIRCIVNYCFLFVDTIIGLSNTLFIFLLVIVSSIQLLVACRWIFYKFEIFPNNKFWLGFCGRKGFIYIYSQYFQRSAIWRLLFLERQNFIGPFFQRIGSYFFMFYFFIFYMTNKPLLVSRVCANFFFLQ